MPRLRPALRCYRFPAFPIQSLPATPPACQPRRRQICIYSSLPALRAWYSNLTLHSNGLTADMNLGDSKLRYVNSSTPQLVHTNSKQSITASDDYYSLISEGSSNDERHVAQRYQTPPLHMRSDEPHRDALQSEATIATIRPIKHKDPGDDEKPEVPIRNEQHRIPRKPVSTSSSEGTIVRRPVSDVITPPTPGVDDTPYIQFAIDQLTRNEEVAGPQHPTNLASYPVERIIPDEGLGYAGSSQQRQPLRPQDRRTESPRKLWSIYPQLPRILSKYTTAADNMLQPAKPMTETFRHPKLNFLPRSLRLRSLGALTFCCLLMIAGLLFCAIYPYSHPGLWQYDGTGTSRYFVFEYLPTLLASFIIIWLQIIQCAIHRTAPFVILSSERNAQNSRALHDMALFPVNHLIPNLSFFRDGEPLLGLCSIIFWLELFTLPLQSCLFQTRYYSTENIWRWTGVQPIAWTLFVLYLLLLVALVLLVLRFVRHQTGLKWDPVSLADIVSLFHRSNFLSDFARSETEAVSTNQKPKHLRLGYWSTSKRASETFYGIGEENAPVPRFSLEKGRMAPNTGYDLEAQEPLKASTFDTLKDVHHPALRYRWTPWFLRDGMVVAWIVIAVVLMLAFVIVSFVKQAVQRGFLPLLAAPTTAQGFSPADFLYGFIPALIGLLLFLLWQPIDFYFRALQPFASLAHRDGALAEESLLLDYTACLPVEVTLKALMNRHYKVAYISFISLLSLTLPVLAGGVFTAQFVVDSQDIRMIASMPGYYALVLFVAIYAVSFIAIWPTRKRRLPHDIRTLGQLVSFVYQSPLLAEPAFAEPRSKIDLVTKLLRTPAGEKQMPRYAFKVYVGRDMREHLGIDRLERFTRFTAKGRIDHLRTGSPRRGDLV